MQLIINSIDVNLTSGVVVKDNNRTNIRAKTLQVLQCLIENKNRVVTKSELLNDIWHDVVVQEQVLVQSIKEIRDLLGIEVIKTFSRQGYRWVGDYTELIKDTESYKKNPKKSFFMLITVLLITVLFVIFIWQNNKDITKANQPLKIAVMPVINEMPDSQHQWVPLEGMNQLIYQLDHKTSLSVIETNNVLYGIEHINNYADLATEDQVFLLRQFLTADIIVRTRLIGFPQDFQLHYIIYTRHGIERGVEFAADVESALTQLANSVAKRFGQSSSPNQALYQSDFSNEAFVSGVEHYLAADYVKAMPMFQAALSANANLLAARRFLATSLANSGDLTKGMALMKENIIAAKRLNNQREHLRALLMLGFWLANDQKVVTRDQDGYQLAENYLQQARELAERYQDKLFIAYSYEELGRIKSKQGQFTIAKEFFSIALVYHQGFRNSYGQTAALIELAKIAAVESQLKRSEMYFQEAWTIANDNDVPVNKVLVLLAKADVQNILDKKDEAISMANKAMEIAKVSNNHYLINKVTAWFNQSSDQIIN
ncbi:MAG: DNA-binding winged helix-turn-helix (wHTH) protein/tetratricopeptide (TPR) repeat protein [Alteromonadaceae bacterium]|jgi:DNA-binding winged helix-turn-helix (wHTH) protein/tetratricopeptide (TPR) repeat protein